LDSVLGRAQELGRHLLVAGLVWVLAVLGVGHGVEAVEVVDEAHGGFGRRLGGRVALDFGGECGDVLGIVGAVLRVPSLGVHGRQVGPDDLHLGILDTHLGNEGVVGGHDLVLGLVAEHHVVVAEEHDNNVDGWLLVQPSGEVAVCCVVGGLGSGMAFMVIVGARELGETVLGSNL
jgi:hypothetical protein